MKRKSEITKKDIHEVIADSAIRSRNLYIFFGGVCLFFLLAGLSTPEEAFLDLSNNGIEIPFAGIQLPYIFFYTTAPLLLLIVQGHLYLNLAKHQQKRKNAMEQDNFDSELMTPFIFNFADKAPKHNDIRSLLFRILNYCVLSVLPILTFAILLFRITDYQDMTLILWYTITLVVSAIFVVSFIPGWSKSLRNVCCIAIFSVVVMCIYIIIYSNYSQIVNSDYAEYCGEQHILYTIPGAKVLTPGKISIPFYHKDSNEYSYTNYAGRSFVCADFTEADFKNQNFVGANFSKAQLNRIQLQGANLRDAELQDANLEEANLQGANLWNANLQGANLKKANLQRAILYFANLQNVILMSSEMQEAQLYFANLQGANLEKADLEESELYHANLQGANLRNAKMREAKLRGANLQGAYLHVAKMQESELEYANLQGAELEDAELQGAKLNHANLQGANLVGARLQRAQLRNAQLQGANLSFVKFKGASCKEEEVKNNGLSCIRVAVNKNTNLTKKNCNIGILSQDDIEKIMEEIPPSTKAIEISNLNSKTDYLNRKIGYLTIKKTTIENRIRQQLEMRVNKTADFTNAECEI